MAADFMLQHLPLDIAMNGNAAVGTAKLTTWNVASCKLLVAEFINYIKLFQVFMKVLHELVGFEFEGVFPFHSSQSALD